MMDSPWREIAMLGVAACATQGVISFSKTLLHAVLARNLKFMSITCELRVKGSVEGDGHIEFKATNTFKGARTPALILGSLENMKNINSFLESEVAKLKK